MSPPAPELNASDVLASTQANSLSQYKEISKKARKGHEKSKQAAAGLSTPSSPLARDQTTMPAEVRDIDSEPSSVSNPVVDQPLNDWYGMTRPHRQYLLKGPCVTIYIGKDGKIAVQDISKRVAMALSRVLNDHFTANPESLDYHLENAAVEADAVYTLLVKYPQFTCKDWEPAEMQFQGTFEKDIALLSAAHLLRMDKYVRSVMRAYFNYLKTHIPKYEEIEILEKLRTSDKDHLWNCMVNHLTHMRYEKCIPDPISFTEFLENHPYLRSAMRRSDELFKEMAVVKRKVVLETTDSKARKEILRCEEKRLMEQLEKERELGARDYEDTTASGHFRGGDSVIGFEVDWSESAVIYPLHHPRRWTLS